MTERFNPLSLRAKILYAALVGLLAGIVAAFIVGTLGSTLINDLYMSEQSVARRREKTMAELTEYVRENRVKGTDSAAISEWCRRNPDVSLLIYGRVSGDVRLFSGGRQTPAATDYDRDDPIFPLHFSDGFYRVSLTVSSESRLYLLTTVLSVFFGCVCVILAVMLYTRRLIHRIYALKTEAATVAGGDLDHPISDGEKDELGSLAGSMNNMRLAVISRMGAEKLAWQSNVELLTAISHDIRTPLTSLIGYLGLLSESDFSDKERARQFTDSAYGKAMELKSLTDELFRYFLVFGKSQPDVELETLDGDLLWQQLMSEAEYDLTDFGFKVRRMQFHNSCTVRADPMQLSRVVNNIVSNVKKYADPSRPVVMISELNAGTLYLCVSNYIIADAPKTESSKIGLMTCRKLMEGMGGSFSVREDERHFSVEFGLPTVS